VILAVAEMPATFHARISARERVYRYRIPIVARRPRWICIAHGMWVRHSMSRRCAMPQNISSARTILDLSRLALQAKSPVKTLDRLDIACAGEEVMIEARARSFLHHQVRNMVGTLKLVGTAKWSPST